MITPMAWPGTPPKSPTQAVDLLFSLYTERGDTRYDGAVTQNEHALQSATLAQRDGAEPALVVAALLHDIGHLLVNEHNGHDGFLTRDEHHERVGAAVLARWFPATVTTPIALHVPAKRYLVATDPDYAATLSTASLRSLAVQGGPMSPAERATFIRRRYANPACRLRRWDDRAKVADLVTPPFEHYRPAIEPLVELQASHP